MPADQVHGAPSTSTEGFPGETTQEVTADAQEQARWDAFVDRNGAEAPTAAAAKPRFAERFAAKVSDTVYRNLGNVGFKAAQRVDDDIIRRTGVYPYRERKWHRSMQGES